MVGDPPPAGDAATMPVPGISWVTPTVSILFPTITEFLFFLVVLLLVISEWPGLRRGLVMTFAGRDSRLTVLKILNEMESGLGSYLLIVTIINACVGALTGLICALTKMPNAIGFGALAATLNFVPIIGPTAMFAILLVVGLVAEPTFALGVVPGRGLFGADHGRRPVPDPDDHRSRTSNSMRLRSCSRLRSGLGFGVRWARSCRRQF